MDLGSVSEAVSDHLDAWLAHDAVVLTYSAMPSEVDPVIPVRDRTVLLTRTPDQGPLTVHEAEGPIERHRFGFDQPAARSPEWDGAIDVVLVPGLAFSPAGDRLGKGAGHYDRFLAHRVVPIRVGVTADALLVRELPAEEHDVGMTHLVTESGIRAITESA